MDPEKLNSGRGKTCLGCTSRGGKPKDRETQHSSSETLDDRKYSVLKILGKKIILDIELSTWSNYKLLGKNKEHVGIRTRRSTALQDTLQVSCRPPPFPGKRRSCPGMARGTRRLRRVHSSLSRLHFHLKHRLRVETSSLLSLILKSLLKSVYTVTPHFYGSDGILLPKTYFHQEIYNFKKLYISIFKNLFFNSRNDLEFNVSYSEKNI